MPSIDPGLFRAYDIRGRTDRSLTPQAVTLVGQAIGSEMKAQGFTQCVLAWDGRPSSPALVEALSSGLMQTGIQPIRLGLLPTGALYFGVHHLNTGCGLMITGSHNPPEYNGIKVVSNDLALADEDIQAIRARIESHDIALTSASSVIEPLDHNLTTAYLDAIQQQCCPARGLRIVLDAGNGAGGPLGVALLQHLGHEVIPLFCDVDGAFPNHHPDPSIIENLKDLQQAVVANKADLGLALDGDADRVWAIDELGQILWPDRLFMRILMDWLPQHPGATVLYDVKCSHLLNKVIREAGGVPEICRTGHSVIKRHMRATQAPLAAEMSGHYFFGDPWIQADDGLYGAAWIAKWLSQQSLSLSQLYAELPKTLSTPEIKLPVPEPLTPHAIVNAFQLPEDPSIERILKIDGIRIETAEGWALIRASNTIPDLTLRFEALTPSTLSQLVDWMDAGLRQTELQLQQPLHSLVTAK